MKKEMLCIIFLLLVIFGCAQQPKVTHVNKFIDCEKPKNDAELKACSLTVENPNLKQCLQFEKVKDAFFCMAFLTKNPEICKNINDSKYYLCRAYTDNNPDMCNEIEVEAEKDMCYVDLGMNLKNEELCNKVKDAAKNSVCLAVINLNIKKCFDDEEIKGMCITNIIEFSKGNVSCDDIGIEERDECLKVSGGK